MKRRQFTQIFTLLGGSLALPVLAGGRSILSVLNTGPESAQLSRSFFEARLGQTFHVKGEEAGTLVLKRIEDACGAHCREQFHAIFETLSGNHLKDGIFHLGCDQHDHFDLFLSESIHGEGQQRLVATINRQSPV